MDINSISLVNIDKDYITKRNNRAKLDTGFHCNYKCEFCYYINNLHLKTSFEEIKRRIDRIHGYGITQIDMSGGESSIHKDWFKILDYCEERFENVSCLSNGSVFSNEKFLKESKEHGLNEILFSLHGYDHGICGHVFEIIDYYLFLRDRLKVGIFIGENMDWFTLEKA